jgi:protein gp37
MADGTHIEWTDATWNPVTGCSVVSPGCTNCYAMRLAGTRLQHHPSRHGLTRDSKAGPVWTGEVRFNESWLDQPLRWKRDRRIFVCAHGDLFAESVPDAWIDRVFAVMALAPQHIFQVLTKRAGRMREYLTADGGRAAPYRQVAFLNERLDEIRRGATRRDDALAYQIGNHGWPIYGEAGDWPLPNVWLGVSVEDQARADERIPDLLATPAAKRFISAEPLLGPVDLTSIDLPDGDTYIEPLSGTEGEEREEWPRLDWVIVGGESGPGARPMHPDWARSLRDSCQAAGVRFFFKQWGEWVSAKGYPGHRRIGHVFPDLYQMVRVGKKAAGRLLDGREWSEHPA